MTLVFGTKTLRYAKTKSRNSWKQFQRKLVCPNCTQTTACGWHQWLCLTEMMYVLRTFAVWQATRTTTVSGHMLTSLRMISGSTWVGIFMAMGSPPHLLPPMQSPWPPPPLCLPPQLGVPCHLWKVHNLRVNQLLLPWMTVQPVRPVRRAAQACLNVCRLMHKTLTSRGSHIRYFRVSPLLQIAIQCLTLTLAHAKFRGNISGRRIQVELGVVVREQFRIEHCT